MQMVAPISMRAWLSDEGSSDSETRARAKTQWSLIVAGAFGSADIVRRLYISMIVGIGHVCEGTVYM